MLSCVCCGPVFQLLSDDSAGTLTWLALSVSDGFSVLACSWHTPFLSSEFFKGRIPSPGKHTYPNIYLEFQGAHRTPLRQLSPRGEEIQLLRRVGLPSLHLANLWFRVLQNTRVDQGSIFP